MADVLSHAASHPQAPAHGWRGQILTYGELASRAQVLGREVASRLGASREPVVVFGHKHPSVQVAMLACSLSGHAYVPIDSSLPAERVRQILECSGATLILGVEDLDRLPANAAPVLALDQWPIPGPDEHQHQPLEPIGPDEASYVIFTSGSTGVPKGVQISSRSRARFTAWIRDLASTYVDFSATQVSIINQAPFSFDLSVMDLSLSWATGSHLVHLDRDHVASPRELFAELERSQAAVWVSTPSFAEMCLAAPEFAQPLLPELRLFLFCGETLPHATASRLRERFPRAAVVNTYGPTESTVAVTSIEIDDDVLRQHPVLPVGAPKPGTTIMIRRPDGTAARPGQTGEIVLGGDTVGMGYLGCRDTRCAFETAAWPDYAGPAYRTGDAGYLVDGQLHFVGRLDLQIKLHGHRIEVEDIEVNLRSLPGVHQAVVVPRFDAVSPTTVSSLHALVQPEEMPCGPTLKASMALKKELSRRIPHYMVPKTVSFVESIPLTVNGKADRAAITASLA